MGKMEEKEKEGEEEEGEDARGKRRMYNINQWKSVNPLPMMMV